MINLLANLQEVQHLQQVRHHQGHHQIPEWVQQNTYHSFITICHQVVTRLHARLSHWETKVLWHCEFAVKTYS